MNSDPVFKNEIAITDASEGCGNDAQGARCHSSSSEIDKSDESTEVIEELCEEASVERTIINGQSGCICKTEHPTCNQVEDEMQESTDSPQQQYSDQEVRQSPNNQVQKIQPKRNGSARAINPNFLSATAAILGNVSDRDDFLSRGNTCSGRFEICPADSDSTKSKLKENEGSIIDGVRKWFSSSSTAADADEAMGHDYYRNVLDDVKSSPTSRKTFFRAGNVKRHDGNKSLQDNSYDESLLENGSRRDFEGGRRHDSGRWGENDGRTGNKRNADSRDDAPQDEEVNEGGDGKHKFKYADQIWGGQVRDKSKNSFDGNNKAADDLRVMEECSFFYDGMDNEAEEQITNLSPSHWIPSHDKEEEKKNGYFREGYSREFHRTRVINHRAVAKPMSSTAKRQWTERRYRRRLKQSAFETPKSIWNNRWHSQQRRESAIISQTQHETSSYELASEHRQAFLAAHVALNAKLTNEYSRNKHAISIAEYGYDLDIDLDLNLSVDNQQEEIRADLTKSSLAIRGSGQIRLPVDNVRLVMDSYLQPGILLVESRARGYMGYDNTGTGNCHGDIKTAEVVPLAANLGESDRTKRKTRKSRRYSPSESMDQAWRRNELSYVLTVDDHLYRRLFKEIR